MRKLAAISALVLITACSSGPADESRTVLHVLMASDWAGSAAVLGAVRDFERSHPGVRIDIKGTQFEHLPDQIRAAQNAGNGPDVVQWHAFAAGAQGFAEPLDDVWRSTLDQSDFLPGTIEDVTWAGRRYGVPLDTNAMLLIYNKAAVRKAGAAWPPRTFADLEEAAKAITAKDRKQRGIGLPSATWNTYGWIRANGGEVVDVGADGKPRFSFDDPRVVGAVRFLGNLVRSGAAYGPAGIAGDRTDAFALLRSGATAVHASGSWDLAALQHEGMGNAYGAAVMPGGVTGKTAGSTMGGSSLFVGKGSPHRALAVAFMVHLIEDRYEIAFAEQDGRLPVRLRVFKDPFFQTPALQTFLEQLKTAHPFILESFPSAHAAFRAAIIEVLQGRAEAAAALRAAQKRATASIG